MSQDNEIARDALPAPPTWISTQHEMEDRARPLRTRYVRVKMRNGAHRIACATYLSATVTGPEDTVEHLYRVSLQWLAEIDPRDGRVERINERPSSNRPTNALQFRVLEANRPDGTRWTLARLGPKGQIGAEPRGVGLMGFLRAILVEWVAERHPDASIASGQLSAEPALDERAARDAFFARSGFRVGTVENGAGGFYATTIKDLKTTWNGEKVVELQPAAIADAFCSQQEAALLHKQVDAQLAENKALARERRAAEVMSRIWLAVTLISFVFGVVMAIQPRLAR